MYFMTQDLCLGVTSDVVYFFSQHGEGGVKLDPSRQTEAQHGPDGSEHVQHRVFLAHFGCFRSNQNCVCDMRHAVFKRTACPSC